MKWQVSYPDSDGYEVDRYRAHEEESSHESSKAPSLSSMRRRWEGAGENSDDSSVCEEQVIEEGEEKDWQERQQAEWIERKQEEEQDRHNRQKSWHQQVGICSYCV